MHKKKKKKISVVNFIWCILVNVSLWNITTTGNKEVISFFCHWPGLTYKVSSSFLVFVYQWYFLTFPLYMIPSFIQNFILCFSLVWLLSLWHIYFSSPFRIHLYYHLCYFLDNFFRSFTMYNIAVYSLL